MTLSGLDQISWSSIEHAYGPATDIPGLLNRIATKTGQKQTSALDDLCNAIVHQGTLYEATPHVVPFLLQLADSADHNLSAMLLGATHSCLNAEPCTSDDSGKQWIASTRSAAASGVGLYRRLLKSKSPEVRMWAAALLGEFPDDHSSRTALISALGSEEHPSAANTMLWSITRLTVDTDRSEWERELRSRLTGPSAFFAAGCLAILQGEAASDEIYYTLAKPADEEELSYLPDEFQLDKLIERLPGPRKIEVLGVAIAHTSYFPLALEHASQMLRIAYRDQREGWGSTGTSIRNKDGSQPESPGLLRMLARMVWMIAVLRVRAAFGMKVPKRELKPTQEEHVEFYGVEGTPLPASELSILQRRTLQLIVNSDAVWQGSTNLWTLFGLPSDRASVRALLG